MPARSRNKPGPEILRAPARSRDLQLLPSPVSDGRRSHETTAGLDARLRHLFRKETNTMNARQSFFGVVGMTLAGLFARFHSNRSSHGGWTVSVYTPVVTTA